MQYEILGSHGCDYSDLVIQDVTPCSLGDEYRDFVEAAPLFSL
jgi:hypothetical protein